MSFRLAALLATAALLVPALSTPAHADGPPGMTDLAPAPEAPAPTHVHRYGYQTFLADAAWVAAAGLAGKYGGSGSLTALGFYCAAPAVHLLHHNRDAAVKSAALRALLPLAGAVAGVILTPASGGDGMAVLGGVLIGFAAGGLTAMVIDWTVLSKETVVDAPRAIGGLAVRPGVSIGKHQVAVSVAGSF